MSIELKCAACRTFLQQAPATLVSPPAVNDKHAVNKYDLCANCFGRILDWILGKGML
jgi:hypothetical protein